MVLQGFPTILSTASIGLLLIFSVSDNFLVLSYEVTDQNNEGVFSSLSRNFDKTLEEINSDDKSQSSEHQDSPSNTANTDDDSEHQDSPSNTANTDDDLLQQNSTLAAESQNSTDIAELEDIKLETPLI
ncbi:hypothetical protein [Candidatus Nitrosocosmicus sp. FF01]|uniref:hypothetical protein n=1 Tax=Candidatus Nitrosocosmicus sp. FF01 TaxID=3397670 RepID=UPI0039ECD87D